MSGPRLALVTRSFWPRVGGAETVMANLAVEFARQGATVTVLTACWNPRWPAEIVHRGVRVVRLPQPALRFWGTWRYMAALDARLRGAELDLVYVSMFKHDAYAAVGACGGGAPVVIRGEGAGLSGDMHWQLDALGGRRIKRRLMKAAAFIAPSRAIEAEIIAAGYPRERIHFIPNGVAPGPSATPSDAERVAKQCAARAALATAHAPLRLQGSDRLVVYTGRLHPAKGLIELVQCWRTVREQVPSARLWIAGEGPLRDQLAAEIEHQGLAGLVTLAGSFDAVDDLLAAADAFVLPSHEEGMSVALLEAMAANLPVVASDVPGNRQLVEHEVHGLLAPPGAPLPLAAALVRVLTDRASAAWASAARQRVTAEFSLAESASAHLRLFAQLYDGGHR